MFRSSNRFLSRKILKGGAQLTTSNYIYPQRTHVHGVPFRCISHESLCRPSGSYAERFPPLFSPLPQLKLAQSLPDCIKRNRTNITTLPNGLRVASEDAVGPAACIGIFVDSGSIYETEESVGVTHLLERLAFKSTRNRSHLTVVREVEATGGNVGAYASREQMAYIYDTLQTYLPQAVELLSDCVRNPIFLESEVEEQVAKLKVEIGEAMKDPQQFLLESLHHVGYSGALGKPLMATEAALERVDGSAITKFYYENYSANRIVLAAYGVDHDQLLALAEPLLYDLYSGSSVEVPKSTYSGGDFRQKAELERTHVALAFEVPGGWNQEKNSTAVTVLQTMMGGGGSFSTGGPGKGMHSRLYLRVLNGYPQVQSISAFSSIYKDTGLFGIHLTAGSDFIAKCVDIAASEMLAIATPGQLTETELNRAKNSTKSAIMMNLESRAINTEDIGKQLLTYKCRKQVEHFLGMLDEITIDDITSVAHKMITSPLTMACVGDVDYVPSYESVSQRFQSQS